MSLTFAELWPVSQLRIVTPLLELRYPTEEDLASLAKLAADGIHDPVSTPFAHPWTDAPRELIGPWLLQYHWRQRSSWTPNGWALPLAVVRNGAVVGSQTLRAEQFAVRREVATVSWLGFPHQGRGIGTEMRAAVLHLAFAGLGALDAVSGALTDNEASLRVSRKLGYLDDGIERLSPRNEVVIIRRLRLSHVAWLTHRRDDITVDGLGGCRPWFGLAASPA